MPKGVDEADGNAYSVTLPPNVISPILPLFLSVNQSVPPGPNAIPKGWLFAVGIENSVILPERTVPIFPPFCSVNQILLSGPTASVVGMLLAVGIVMFAQNKFGQKRIH